MTDDISVSVLGTGDWPRVEELFGKNGGCGGCWCMLWRLPKGGKYWDQNKGEPNRRQFKSRIEAGEVHGCLAFDGNQPVGWCSIGPKESFPYFGRSRVLKHLSPPGTWSVTCFFIKTSWRGKGVAGARHLEGYPVVPKSDLTPVPAAFAWTGVPKVFESAGF